MKLLAAVFFSAAGVAIAPCKAGASDLLGPIWHLQGKHIGYVDALSWSIQYVGQQGCTTVGADGAVFHHGSCERGPITSDATWAYPEKYWGEYPMYYLGGVMSYRITLANTDPSRTYRHLRLVAIQEYFSPEEEWGEWMGEDAAKDWYIPELKPSESAIYEGSFHIALDGRPGLNQTHIQVQHWNGGTGIPGPGSVIIDDAKSALWCPPEAAADGLVLPEAAAVSSESIEITGGERGYIESGQPLTVEVRAAQAGPVRVAVYDRRGALVWESAVFAGAGMIRVFNWDGTGLSGSPVAPGVYLVLVEGPGVQAKQKVAVIR